MIFCKNDTQGECHKSFSNSGNKSKVAYYEPILSTVVLVYLQTICHPTKKKQVPSGQLTYPL